MISLFREHIHVGCIRIHVMYRVNQAEYVSHMLVVAPQEYVSIYSTRRSIALGGYPWSGLDGGWSGGKKSHAGTSGAHKQGNLHSKE